MSFGKPNQTNIPTSLAELIEIADRENWCTKTICTTCGAIPFRTALRHIPRDEVIAGLRHLPKEFFKTHKSMFLLIVQEVAFFPGGGDLLESLEGSLAGAQLRANIDYQNYRTKQRQAYLATQTPEAITKRRIKKKAARDEATAPHRSRKTSSHASIANAQKLLAAIPTDKILETVTKSDFGVPLRAIGGLLYKRLFDHFQLVEVTPIDKQLLFRLAKEHSGHWQKLVDHLKWSHQSKKS